MKTGTMVKCHQCKKKLSSGIHGYLKAPFCTLCFGERFGSDYLLYDEWYYEEVQRHDSEDYRL